MYVYYLSALSLFGMAYQILVVCMVGEDKNNKKCKKHGFLAAAIAF